MNPKTDLRLSDALYPQRLLGLPTPPASLSIAGGALEAPCAVAIVGTREPCPAAEQFAFELAAAVAGAGAVVVSGGAVGIDAAAHRGALAAGGRTWAVAATGRKHCFPKEHAELFAEIARGPGAMVWPFAEDVPALTANFLRRNGVLVALAHAVVIVQAAKPSGTLSALAWARRLGRAVWAVPGPPWDASFEGCRIAIESGARTLTSPDRFLRELGLAPGASMTLPFAPPLPAASRTPPPPPSDPGGRALWDACTVEPRHTDEIAARARVCAQRALTGLLTLALENVLVEGPVGFYRRQNER